MARFAPAPRTQATSNRGQVAPSAPGRLAQGTRQRIPQVSESARSSRPPISARSQSGQTTAESSPAASWRDTTRHDPPGAARASACQPASSTLRRGQATVGSSPAGSWRDDESAGGVTPSDPGRAHGRLHKVKITQARCIQSVRFMVNWINSLCIWPCLTVENVFAELKNGLLLCRLVEQLIPGVKIDGIYQKALARKPSLSNLEKGLAEIHKCNANRRNLCTSEDLYEGREAPVARFLVEAFETLAVKEIRGRVRRMVADLDQLLVPFDRRLQEATVRDPLGIGSETLVEDFADCTRVMLALHVFDLVGVEDIKRLQGQPRSREDFRDNAQILQESFRDLGIPVLLSEEEWAKPPVPCPGTLLAQLNAIWLKLIGSPVSKTRRFPELRGDLRANFCFMDGALLPGVAADSQQAGDTQSVVSLQISPRTPENEADNESLASSRSEDSMSCRSSNSVVVDVVHVIDARGLVHRGRLGIFSGLLQFKPIGQDSLLRLDPEMLKVTVLPPPGSCLLIVARHGAVFPDEKCLGKPLSETLAAKRLDGGDLGFEFHVGTRSAVDAIARVMNSLAEEQSVPAPARIPNVAEKGALGGPSLRSESADRGAVYHPKTSEALASAESVIPQPDLHGLRGLAARVSVMHPKVPTSEDLAQSELEDLLLSSSPGGLHAVDELQSL